MKRAPKLETVIMITVNKHSRQVKIPVTKNIKDFTTARRGERRFWSVRCDRVGVEQIGLAGALGGEARQEQAAAVTQVPDLKDLEIFLLRGLDQT